MLYKLANQEGGFKPQKYFSIDRVFRNESMDKTHLCEFHQVEGLVADYDLSLKDLIGMIKTFFESIGITELRFKPAFNPYTEPSMEVLFEKKKKRYIYVKIMCIYNQFFYPFCLLF
jgi:phenylalanyl-tRNA synthetase alpha chain